RRVRNCRLSLEFAAPAHGEARGMEPHQQSCLAQPSRVRRAQSLSASVSTIPPASKGTDRRKSDPQDLRARANRPRTRPESRPRSTPGYDATVVLESLGLAK